MIINLKELEQVVGKLLNEMPDRGVKSKEKPDGTRYTSEDIKNNQVLEAFLKEHYGDWVRVLEEDSNKPSLSGFSGFSVHAAPTIWGDPVDGSMPFLLGMNYFGIAVAFYDEKNRPRCGVFFQKRCQYTFEGDESGNISAFVNGVPLIRNDDAKFENIKIEKTYLWISSDSHRMANLSKWPGKVRAMGATSHHLAVAAEDTIGDPLGVILTRYKRYDLAATIPLIQAAGRELWDLKNRTPLKFKQYYDNAKDNEPLLVAAPGWGSEILNYIK